jgi:hypothetical protein
MSRHFPTRKNAAAQKKHDDNDSSNKELPPPSNDEHVLDWILVVLYLLQWHQRMKLSTIAKSQEPKTKFAVQWLADASCCCCFPTFN